MARPGGRGRRHLALVGALVIACTACSTAPSLQRQTWLEGHDGDVVTLSVAAAGGRTSSRHGVDTELQWVELEAYHKFNVGLFAGYDRSTFGAVQLPNGVTRETRLVIWSLGPVYTVSIGEHVDVGGHLGVDFLKYQLVDVDPGPECIRVGEGPIDISESDAVCFGAERFIAEERVIGWEASANIWFPVWYYRAGVSLRWRLQGNVPDAFAEQVGRQVDHMTFTVLIHWLSFTSEERPL